MKGKILGILAFGLLAAPLLANAQDEIFTQSDGLRAGVKAAAASSYTPFNAPPRANLSSAPFTFDFWSAICGECVSVMSTANSAGGNVRSHLAPTNEDGSEVQALEIDPSSAARTVAVLLGCLVVARVRRRKMDRLRSSARPDA